RALCYAAPLPRRFDRRPGSAPGELRAVEESRIRQAGGRSLRRCARRYEETDRHLASCAGDLAARATRHPARTELSPHPVEHDLLEELADRGASLRQRRTLAFDLRNGAVEPATRVSH